MLPSELLRALWQEGLPREPLDKSCSLVRFVGLMETQCMSKYLALPATCSWARPRLAELSKGLQKEGHRVPCWCMGYALTTRRSQAPSQQQPTTLSMEDEAFEDGCSIHFHMLGTRSISSI